MEKKNFDIKSFIGFLLIGIILIMMMNQNKKDVPPADSIANDSVPGIQKVDTTTNTNVANLPNTVISDSLLSVQAVQKLGYFAASSTLKEEKITIENNVLRLVIDTKGAQIVEAELKEYKTFRKVPLYMIEKNNASFQLDFQTNDGRSFDTKNLTFSSTKTMNGENEVLTLRLPAGNNQFLEYRYEMKPNDYMVDFSIRSQGLASVLNTSKPINLKWDLDGFRHEKSMYSENMYTYYYYKQDEDVTYLSPDDKETEEDVKWVAYKQHFFTSALFNKEGFKSADLTSKQLYDSGNKQDSTFIKGFGLETALSIKGGEVNENMNWYFGPNDYENLKTNYPGTDIEEIVDLGWGIFGVVNKYIFIPIFGVLKGLITNYGLLIIILTIVVRLLMSPLVYKSYLSSAKMKVLRPEMQEIAEKHKGKDNALKRQQETMALQRKAGVNPMAGCIPAVLQMPIFFALFKFFPSNLELRQKGFLWADDLSSYDVVYKLPFDIPFYGDHVSLFPILASIAIFFYMKMSQSQQMNMQQPAQEGMPDMQKMMKYMLYFSPLMMLVFFNSYAASLSLYYFVSNLLTIGIMFVIKNFVIDEKKILAGIEQNKQKTPKKKSKFRTKIDEAMRQAQEQQEKSKKK